MIIKAITTIDDYIRIVAMTLLAFVFTYFFGIEGTAKLLFVAIGMVIDIHDFVSKIKN